MELLALTNIFEIFAGERRYAPRGTVRIAQLFPTLAPGFPLRGLETRLKKFASHDSWPCRNCREQGDERNYCRQQAPQLICAELKGELGKRKPWCSRSCLHSQRCRELEGLRLIAHRGGRFAPAIDAPGASTWRVSFNQPPFTRSVDEIAVMSHEGHYRIFPRIFPSG
ncbi:hypothetical protein BH11PSE11_BH11PSE11_38550 [soil metagenome]